MRSLVLLTILILCAGFGYIGFSVLSFEPEVTRYYNLNASQDDSNGNDAQKESLSPQEQTKKDSIVALLKKGLEKYESAWDGFPVQTADMSLSLLSGIRSGVLPVYYPVNNFMNSGNSISTQAYTTLIPLSSAISQVAESSDEAAVSQARCERELEGFILGDTGKNALHCESATSDKVRIYLSGPDADSIKVRGNAIVNTGTGDDQIEAGSEFLMVYVEPNFGRNLINVDCSDSAQVLNDEVSRVIPWEQEHRNFIVFDPRISKDDVTVSDNLIKHNITDDQVMMNKNCFNIVFLAEE